MQHEQSLIDAFNAFMRGEAQRLNLSFHSFSLDGQDRDTGGDYVLSDSSRFSIVEFKYTDRDLISEKHKPRRLQLCKALEGRSDMCEFHDQCHYISWSGRSSGKVKLNIYRHEVCTQATFGATCGLREQVPRLSTRMAARKFADEFFRDGGAKSLSSEEFESYIAWVLTETSDSAAATLELVVYDPTERDLRLVRLNSIREAWTWMQAKRRKPPKPGL